MFAMVYKDEDYNTTEKIQRKKYTHAHAHQNETSMNFAHVEAYILTVVGLREG